MSTRASPDRYTPCAPRPTEEYARRRANNGSLPRQAHKDILHQLSSSLSVQEMRISELMRDLDVGLENSAVQVSIGTLFNTPLSTPGPSQSSPKHLQQPGQTSHIVHPPPFQRPGRISPTTIQMILSQNHSTVFSEASSGADTSYDSGLYQWLGLKESTSRSEISYDSPFFPQAPSDMKNVDPDSSTLSSRSAYSQQSPLSSSPNRSLLPLSPPLTVRPPFSESLCSDETEVRLPIGPQFDPDAVARSNIQFSQFTLKERHDETYNTAFQDFKVPMLLKNVSLQHYMPSAIVLRHFQQVVDELRGKYVPNDEGNNIPKRERTFSFSKRPNIIWSRSLPGSPRTPPSPFSPSSLSNHAADALPKFEDQHFPRARFGEIQSRATRELYTEMAVMLFGQAEEAAVQVRVLRCLADRFEILARKKRETALVVGKRGKGREVS